MIIQIDHIAVSCLKCENEENFVQANGYNLLFKAVDIPNPSMKKIALKTFSEKHTLHFYTNNNNLNIEFIHYDSINSQNGFITPVFEGIKPWDTEVIEERNIFGQKYIYAKLNVLETEAFFKESDNDDFRFKEFMVFTKDMNKSTAFWSKLGFKPVISEQDYSKLKFSSMFSKETFSLILIRDDTRTDKYFIDDNGFNCIGLISNNAVKEKELFMNKGFKTSEIESFESNGKILNIFFLIGPSGEIVEIISPKKEANHGI